MPLTPLQRKAAFLHAATMHETTRTAAALSLGFSWTHVEGVMAGSRPGAAPMKQAVAEYCALPFEDFWGEPMLAQAAS